ncbi:MAG: hypothetical protein ACXWC4_07720 [Telluria sp.]
MRTAVLALASLAVGSAVAAGPAVSMNAQQLYLFQAAYPDAEVVFDCQGNFSGASAQEHVLGIKRDGAKPARVGLLLDSGKWVFHDIDHELDTDKLPPRRWPYPWEVAPTAAAPKCNADPRRDRDLSDNGKVLGYRPLFVLRQGQANACFGTSAQYNNWDCVAYRNGQFRLWYQQVFAD